MVNNINVHDIAARCLRDEAEAILNIVPQINGTFDKAVELLVACAGKVIVSGSVGSFDVHGIAGKVEISSDIPLADDCAIRNIMGDVSVTLPKGCAFKVKKDDVVGVVIAKGSKKGEHTVTIENIMGKVSILNTNA